MQMWGAKLEKIIYTRVPEGSHHVNFEVSGNKEKDVADIHNAMGGADNAQSKK